MRILPGAIALVIVVSAALDRGLGQATAPGAEPMKLSAQRLDDRITIRINDQTFTVYRFGAGQKYPYFYPVNGPASGVSVTTESSLPWPHHRSLFFGCDKVNGGNYWQEGNELGQIVSKGPVIAHDGPDYIQITDQAEWRRPGQAPIIIDTRDIRIHVLPNGARVIDFQVTLLAQVDVKIEKTNHSLFAARMVPELSVQRGGTLLNATGGSAEKGTFAVASPWADYSGSQCGSREGLAIFDSPRNPWFPSKWFTRDYGFFSPTPFEWLDEKGVQLPSGKSLQLSYRVVVHSGDAEQAGIAELFRKWAEEQKAEH